MRSLLFIAIILSASCFIYSYNISPVPNVILRLSNRTKDESTRSAFFGFSLNLRKNHIMIGAPRANSTLANDFDVKKPGQVYKCNFDGNCEEFMMGQEKQFDKRIKSEQLFGFSMDGFEDENDKFVACAPKHIVNDTDDYRMIGSCYFVQSTRNNYGNESSKAIEPLNDPFKYISNRTKSNNEQKPFFYAYGESGFSVHIPDEKKNEILIGCPSVLLALGAISKFITFPNKTITGITGDSENWDFQQENILDKDSYFGYAITSGKFLLPKSQTLLYVASAYRRNNRFGKGKNDVNNGMVLFLEINTKKNIPYHRIYHQLRGTLIGSGFGYALLSDDFNNDGLPDLVVSAPFYGFKNSYDNGQVFVFINKGLQKDLKPNFGAPSTLRVPNPKGGEKFGMALGKIGDINQDGFNDLAISSITDDGGKIFIYFGSNDGLILGQEILTSNRNSMFGFSISRGVDIDGNNFNDFAVGAPNDDAVYLYKSYPIINIEGILKPSKNQVELNDTIEVSACLQLKPKYALNFDVELKVDFLIDSRSSFANSSSKTTNFTVNVSEHILTCENFTLNIHVNLNKTANTTDIEPIALKMNYSVTKNISNEFNEFCNDCVFLNRSVPSRVNLNLPVATGCSSSLCKPNLKLEGNLIDEEAERIINITKTVSILYTISNLGEPAYFPTLSIQIPQSVKFSTIPSICNEVDKKVKISCKLKNIALKQNKTATINITLDVSEVQKHSIQILAKTQSNGEEVDQSDNEAIVDIPFEERSQIEINGRPSVSLFVFEENAIENLTMSYTYKIFNQGPSLTQNFTFELFIPQIIDSNKKIIEIKSVKYIYKELHVELKNELTEHAQTNDSVSNSTQKISETIQVLLLNCDQDNIGCLSVKGSIENFECSEDDPIEVIIKFKMIGKLLDKLLNKTVPTLSFKPKFMSLSHEPKTMVDLEIIIKKEIPETTPLWVWIAAILGGIIFLLLLILTLAKLGFFKRKIKEELVRAKRETLLFPMAHDLNFSPDE